MHILLVAFIFLSGIIWGASPNLPFNWQISTIPSLDDVGIHPSIAIDSSGRPHVSYTNLTTGRLMYSYWTGSSWTTSVVGTHGSCGYYTSLALDNKNNGHISHYDMTKKRLLYTNVYHIGTQSFGTSTVVDNGGAGRFSSLKLDLDGRPNIAYYDEKNMVLKYTFWTGIDWIKHIVDYSPKKDRGRFASLFLIEDTLPCMSYYDATDGDLRFAFWNVTEWGSMTIDTLGDVGRFSSIAGTAGALHIAYYDATNANLKYAFNSTGEWIIRTIDTSDDVGQYCSIALDGLNVYISYYDATNKDLRIAYGSGSTWGTQAVDSSGDVGMYSSICVHDGAVHIAYYDNTNGKLKYATLGTETIPNSPSDLVATAISSSTINLSWSDNSINEECFIVERGQTITTFSQIGTTTLATYTDTGLSSNTTYYYRVCAYNQYGTSGYSNIASAVTFDIPPIAPSSLVATAIGSSIIGLSWDDNSTNELWFIIERGSTITALVYIGTTTNSTYTVIGLSPRTSYYFRVYAWNLTGGSSNYSNIASSTTWDIPPPPPSTLTATGISNSAINLSWFDNSDNEIGFVIERGSTITAFVYIGTTTNSTYTDTGLLPNTRYYYSVCAYNTMGTSSYSNIASATTGLTLLYLSPSPFVVGSGSTSTIKVMIDNVVNMVGASIYLSFDPDILEVSTITFGDFPPGASILFEQFDNASGTIVYSPILMTGSSTGSGTIANIEFRGKSSGTSAISFEVSEDPSIKKTNLIDNDGGDIPFSWQNAFSSSTIMGTLTGKIVSLGTESMEFSGIIVGVLGIGTTTTDNLSMFTFVSIPVGTYTLWADTYGAGSITYEICVGTETDIGTISLLAGDTDDSGQVNLADFYRLRKEFGQSAEGLESDFNHDGNVDLIDFYILRHNFGKIGILSKSTKIQNNNVSLSILPDSFSIKEGEEYEIDINIENVSSLIACSLHIFFNQDVLDLVKIENGGFLKNAQVLEEKQENGKIKYTLALFTGEVVGSGCLARILFLGKKDAFCRLSFDNGTRLMDKDGNYITFETKRENATVKIEPQDISIFIDEEIDVSIFVSYPDLLGAQIEILYPDCLEPLKIEKGDLLSGVFLFGTSNGKITIVCARIGACTNSSGKIANILFKGIKEGVGSISFSLVDLRDSNNSKVSSSVYPANITIKDYFMGDLNKDKKLDLDDLMFIITNWKKDIPDYDIGPAAGKPPKLIPAKDGIIDFEDLMVFCLMWNYVNSNSHSKAKSQSSNIIWIEEEGREFVIKYKGSCILGGHIELFVDGFFDISPKISPFVYLLEKNRLIIDFGIINNFDGEIARIRGDNVLFERVDIRDMENNKMNVEKKDIVYLSVLFQSYPNPANNACYIPFKLAKDSNVSIEIYNILGQKIRTIDVGQRRRGSYTQKDKAIFWDLRNDNAQPVSKGLYFYKLKAGDFSSVKSMVIRR
ncbi:TPA: hypothetical protein DCX16_06565 [bacterium]|nr:hypothetical protein [bacterium]